MLHAAVWQTDRYFCFNRTTGERRWGLPPSGACFLNAKHVVGGQQAERLRCTAYNNPQDLRWVTAPAPPGMNAQQQARFAAATEGMSAAEVAAFVADRLSMSAQEKASFVASAEGMSATEVAALAHKCRHLL